MPTRPSPLTTSTPLGWIGTGVMGLSMCGHLQRRGHPVTIYSRTKERAQPLIDNGAAWVDAPAGVVEHAEVVFTMVGSPSDVRAVYMGDGGLLQAAGPGRVLVDMTTTEPSLSREVYFAAKVRDVATIDAPVSGGDIGARNAALSIMVGGDRQAVEWIAPLLETLGKKIVYQGGPGSGQHAKMCNQIAAAGTMVAVCESLLYGYKAGLDLETMLSSIRGGAAACWTLENLAPRILERNFDPGFLVEHFIKDLAIALEEARRMRIALPGLALVQQLYLSVQAQGHGRLGSHALMLALEHLSGIDRPPGGAPQA